MKNTLNFISFITITFFWCMIGCEQSAIQTEPILNEAIETRTDDCNDCPLDDCCCGIEYLSGSNSLTVQFCGTSGSRLSDQLCSATPPSPCSEITGYLFGPVGINSTNTKQAFCMNPGDSFVIYVGGSGTASFKITCQDDVGTPQTITVSLTGGNRYYFDTNGSCEVDECT